MRNPRLKEVNSFGEGHNICKKLNRDFSFGLFSPSFAAFHHIKTSSYRIVLCSFHSRPGRLREYLVCMRGKWRMQVSGPEERNNDKPLN